MLLPVIILYVAVLLYFSLDNIVFKGNWAWSVLFLCLYLPFYTTILSVVYSSTGSRMILSIFQYLKEIIVILGVLSFLLYQKDPFGYVIRMNMMDKLFMAFLGLATLYLFIPLGEASFINKLLYLKNTLIIGVVYFFGRNADFTGKQVDLLFRCIMGIAIAAFILNVLEVTVIGNHFQTYTGYALYNYEVNDQEVSGNYGLTWTFETQSTSKRLASFFSDPLELASSILLGFAAGLIFYLTTERKDYPLYLVVMVCSLGSLFFSSSRAAFAAFFVMVFYIAIIFKLYKLILFGGGILVSFIIYILFLASEELYFFVLDTITFQNASSVAHVVEWLVALDTMTANPMGIGLAMSGNIGSVSEDLRVGGENQFLIFGVQLGFLGMFLYIMLLIYGVVISIKVFRLSPDVNAARIAFVGAAVKVGMLLPLFTANAEMYTYVSWLTWWMIGFSVQEYNRIKYVPKLAL